MSFFDSEDMEFELIAEGEHDAVLDDVEIDEKHVNKSGDVYPQITYTWKLGKRKLWQRLMFKESTKGIVANAVKGFGIRDEVKAKVSDPDDSLAAANAVFEATRRNLNKAYQIYVKNNEFNGKTYQNVYVNKPIDKVVKNEAPSFDKNEEVPF